MSQEIIIDFTLDNVSKTMIKELAYVNTKTGESMCYFMNEPVLVKNKLIQLDNNNIITIFDYLAKTSENIFLIRGKRQLNILTNLTGRKFHNLEDYGCPEFDSLPFPQIYCGQHTQTHSCALKRAKAFAAWYNE